MSENISPELAYERFYFAGERCECCGKQISRNNRGRDKNLVRPCLTSLGDVSISNHCANHHSN